MTLDQIRLVQTSLHIISHNHIDLAGQFYSYLFAHYPDVRYLFKNDIHAQAEKFMAMLMWIVRHVGQPEVLIPAVKQLAERHVQYGVEITHYEAVRCSLMWALGRSLGHEFTAELRQAWEEMFYLLSGLMKEVYLRKPLYLG